MPRQPDNLSPEEQLEHIAVKVKSLVFKLYATLNDEVLPQLEAQTSDYYDPASGAMRSLVG